MCALCSQSCLTGPSLLRLYRGAAQLWMKPRAIIDYTLLSNRGDCLEWQLSVGEQSDSLCLLFFPSLSCLPHHANHARAVVLHLDLYTVGSSHSALEFVNFCIFIHRASVYRHVQLRKWLQFAQFSPQCFLNAFYSLLHVSSICIPYHASK